jgi:hypothetical protein
MSWGQVIVGQISCHNGKEEPRKPVSQLIWTPGPYILVELDPRSKSAGLADLDPNLNPIRCDTGSLQLLKTMVGLYLVGWQVEISIENNYICKCCKRCKCFIFLK